MEHTRRTPGTPCWVSLTVHDLAATQKFYGTLFGWEFQPGPGQLGPYVRALLRGHEVAGIGQLPPGRRLPVAWTPYLATDDVDATAETVRHRGGTVGVGPLDMGSGRLALASDPAGAVFGLWQAVDDPGIRTGAVPGAPAWSELLTYETSGVAKFYQAVFGYAQEALVSVDTDFLTLYLRERPVASVRGLGRALPREHGAHWVTYFETTDVDEAVELAVDLGGRVVKPASDEPLGRTATLADHEGAQFTLVRSGSRQSAVPV